MAELGFLKDTQWVRQAFLVRAEHLEALDSRARFHSTADLKFVDTSVGGNLCINPPPQFTRHADIKMGGAKRAASSKGIGRFYSESIDDHSQIIYIRMGVPQFNSLTTFFNGYYNSAAGQLARSGRATNLFYDLGKAAGFVVSILSWKLLAVRAIGKLAKWALEKPTSKFYYMKPTMVPYWSTVQTLVNNIAVNMGIVPRIGGNPASIKMNPNYEFDEAAQRRMHELLPDVFSEKGGQIDVYAIANRAQRLARQREKRSNRVLDQANVDLQEAMKEIYGSTLEGGKPNYQTYMQKWLESEQSKPKMLAGDRSGTQTGDTESVENNAKPGWLDKWSESLEAELDDGSAFAGFRVNFTGSISESFSNSVTESELQNKINSISSSARSASFSFANGNVAPILGDVIQGVKDFVSGIADGVGMSGLAALGGAAFVDIPKQWHSSIASLPRASYTINLTSPYGNPISRLLNLYLPLSMLLAAALPRSTGAQSYTSPYLIEYYDQGRAQSRLCMFDQLAITRGTGNLGWNDMKQPLAIDVSFSFVDLSSVMHVPITMSSMTGDIASMLTGGFAGLFDDDNTMNDYLACLTGLGVTDQIYPLRKLKMALTKKMAQWSSWTSPYRFAAIAGDSIPGRLASAFYSGTIR